MGGAVSGSRNPAGDVSNRRLQGPVDATLVAPSVHRSVEVAGLNGLFDDVPLRFLEYDGVRILADTKLIVLDYDLRAVGWPASRAGNWRRATS
jgi:hypothetical protein